ncbi:unnamed protein product, partial [Allacma fusca]
TLRRNDGNVLTQGMKADLISSQGHFSIPDSKSLRKSNPYLAPWEKFIQQRKRTAWSFIYDGFLMFWRLPHQHSASGVTKYLFLLSIYSYELLVYTSEHFKI